MISSYIREMVEADCNSANNAFGAAFFSQHILAVREYALKLAERLHADPEAVELAAYLHDISAIRDFSTLIEHAAAGADLAETILKDKLYDLSKIEMIRKAVTNHSKPMQQGQGSPEEVCLSNADAISQIIRPGYWMYYVFSVRKMSYEQGMDWYREKVNSNWNNLIPEAKKLIHDEYSLTKTAFDLK